MGDDTKIEWTDATWNPAIGCARVSEGCRNCYAETMAKRIVAMSRGRGERSPYEDVVRKVDGQPMPRWNGRAVFLPERLDQPLRWTKPRRVFVNSMSDLFHEDLEFAQIAAVFGVMAASPQHTYQCLSKRPERMLAFMKSNPVERAAAWLYDAMYGQGNETTTKRAVRSGFGRACLAHRAKIGSRREDGRRISHGRADHPVRASASGIRSQAGLSDGLCDDRPGSLRGDGSSNGMVGDERSHTRRSDDQSHQRREGRQPPGEPGTGNAVGATTARLGGSSSESTQADRQHAPQDQAPRIGRAGDSPASIRGDDGENHRREVRDETEGDFGDLQPEDVEAYLASIWPLPNVWTGASIEDQATADERIPLLLRCPAAVRFVSAEPLLSEIDFYNASADWDMLTGENYGQDSDGAPEPRPNWPGLDWVIVGGESGPGARECDVAWIRSIVEQCGAAGVPVFVKQLGAKPVGSMEDIRGHIVPSVFSRNAQREKGPLKFADRKGGDIDEWPEDLRVRQLPGGE